jgi:CheY-like chemotaxis protein
MPGRPARILCMDDQAVSLYVRKMLLEQFGCEVVAVHDAQSCLSAAVESSFDVALLDYHLGGTVTGEDVARDLRICSPNTALVMLTGDPKIPDSARESVDVVITKGTSSPEDLFSTLQQLAPDCTLKPRHQPFSPELFSKIRRDENS